jgi:coenzyme F420-reducing hydrogenase delta subunit
MTNPEDGGTLRMADFEPHIIGFLCNWCAYEGADAAGRKRLEVPPGLRTVRVLCSGRVDPRHVLEAFVAGADGVLILGCRVGECRYRDGNLQALKRVSLLRHMLAPLGIEPERLALAWVAAGEAERFAGVTEEMIQTLQTLGPLRRA